MMPTCIFCKKREATDLFGNSKYMQFSEVIFYLNLENKGKIKNKLINPNNLPPICSKCPFTLSMKQARETIRKFYRM